MSHVRRRHCTADRAAGNRTGGGGPAAGFSLVEAIIAGTILLTMILVLTQLALSGSEAQRYSERTTRATEICQDLVDEIRRNLQSSVYLFQDDGLGNGYLALARTSPSAPAITSRLPELRTIGVFERETTTDPFTGNTLFFARHAWTDRYTCTSSRAYSLDVYRLVRFYMKTEDGGPRPDRASGLNLCRYVSEPLVDGREIDAISDSSDRKEILSLLAAGRTTGNIMVQPTPVHPPVALVWRLAGPLADPQTLRQIDPGSWNLSTTPLPPRPSTWEIARDAGRSSDGLLFYRHHSVASNFAPNTLGVGTFSQMVPSGDGFPHGFEVQIIGPTAARQVLMRLAVVSTNLHGHTAHAVMQVIQDCRDG